jgi:23S rRNA pseudouridine2605 synthase
MPRRRSQPRPPSRVRLQKILAAAGVASRRAAEDLLRAGRVTVNGRTAHLGESADPARDKVSVDGVRVEAEPREYWLAYKPRGVITTVSDPQGRPTVLSLVPRSRTRLFPVGRLDRESEGLVLLTNDGPLAQRLLHPSHETEREYRVTVRGRVTRAELHRLERGVELEEGRTAPARAGAPTWSAARGTSRFALTLIEGRKRQIRRALEALGHPVVRLVRVRMGPLRLGHLAAGTARPLRPDELRALARVGRGGGSGSAPAGGRGKPRRGRGQSRSRPRAKSRPREPSA